MISWYTTYIKSSIYDISLVNCFIRNGISVVRAYQKADILVIEIFASSNLHAIDALIAQSIRSLPLYQDISVPGISLFEGVELVVEPDVIYYTGDHIEKEIIQYFSLGSPIEGDQPFEVKNSYYPRIILEAAIMIVVLALLLSGLLDLGFVLILLVVFSFSIVRQKYQQSFAYQMQVRDQTVSYTTILGERTIAISSICQLDIRMKRGDCATIDHTGGQFYFPFRGIVPPNNEQQFLSAIIAGAGLALTSGRNRMSCTFRPMQPYFRE